MPEDDECINQLLPVLQRPPPVEVPESLESAKELLLRVGRDALADKIREELGKHSRDSWIAAIQWQGLACFGIIMEDMYHSAGGRGARP